MIILNFILGLSIGSFLNVLIDRLPKGQQITGRSYCDHCKKTLRATDLIPVVAYVFLGGRSSCCGKSLSLFYPFVELLTGVSFIIADFYLDPQGGSLLASLGWTPEYFFLIGILCSLIVIFFSDLKYHIIPDEATMALFIFSTFTIAPIINKTDHLIGSLVLIFGMYGLYFATKGKGLGFGDVKLAPVIGWLLGLVSGFIALYIAFIIGGIVSGFLLLFRRRKLKSRIAFGPFLVIGILVMLFFEPEILAYVSRLFH